MSETNSDHEIPTPVVPPGAALQMPVPEPVAAPGDLERSVRTIKIWLSVLTAVVAIALIGLCSVVGIFFAGLSVFFDSGPYDVSEEQIDRVYEEIDRAFGPDLESVEVRVISVDWGYDPMPFSWIGGGGEPAIYVEYRLRGIDVLVADTLGGPYGADISSSGMIPTRGTLASRMTEEQFEAVLAAYARETRAPLGAVRRYTDQSQMMFDSSVISDTVVVGGTEYPARELWALTEGRLVEGDRLDMSAMNAYSRTAHVFHEDAESGEFAYLGTEQTEVWW